MDKTYSLYHKLEQDERKKQILIGTGTYLGKKIYRKNTVGKKEDIKVNAEGIISLDCFR